MSVTSESSKNSACTERHRDFLQKSRGHFPYRERTRFVLLYILTFHHSVEHIIIVQVDAFVHDIMVTFFVKANLPWVIPFFFRVWWNTRWSTQESVHTSVPCVEIHLITVDHSVITRDSNIKQRQMERIPEAPVTNANAPITDKHTENQD